MHMGAKIDRPAVLFGVAIVIVSVVLSCASAFVISWYFAANLEVPKQAIEHAKDETYQRVLDDLWPAHEAMYRQMGMPSAQMQKPKTIREMMDIGERYWLTRRVDG